MTDVAVVLGRSSRAEKLSMAMLGRTLKCLRAGVVTEPRYTPFCVIVESKMNYSGNRIVVRVYLQMSDSNFMGMSNCAKNCVKVATHSSSNHIHRTTSQTRTKRRQSVIHHLRTTW